MNSNSALVQKEEQQQIEAVNTIARYGIVISVSYAVLYFFMSFHLFATFNVVMSISYALIYVINKRNILHIRPTV